MSVKKVCLTHQCPQKQLLRYRSSTKKCDEKAKEWVQKTIKRLGSNESDSNHAPTDCFGEIYFEGATRKSKAKFIRFSDSTSPADIYKLMTRYWKLDKPSLLISVTGGAKNFHLDPKLKALFNTGLQKVALIPGTWVITGGTNTGVMKHVGEALQGTCKAVIGISTFGVITNRECLLACDYVDNFGGKFPYRVSCSLVEHGAYLDHNHTHHLMLDDGSRGKYGREIQFRAQFEKYVMGNAVTEIAAVLLVLQGGIETLDQIWSALCEDSSLSIVIVKDSGKTADLIAYALDVTNDVEMSEVINAKIQFMIKKLFPELNDEIQQEMRWKVLLCTRKREAFTVFRMSGESSVDGAILKAILKGQRTSPLGQLMLTLLWNRPDLAKLEILSQARTWQLKDLNTAMIFSLAMDRVDFVKLLLEYGVSIELLLNNNILEFLYGFRAHKKTSTLNYELDGKEYVAVNMVGYENVAKHLCSIDGINVKKSAIPRRIVHRIIRSLCKNLMSKGNERFIETLYGDKFLSPYRELFFWAVLNNQREMAIYLWQFEEEAMSKALIAAEISTVLHRHADLLDLPDDIVNALAGNAQEFKDLAFGLLDECHRMDETKTIQLITTEFFLHSSRTCLGLAVDINDLNFVSHSSVQLLLDEVWTGYIKVGELTDMELMIAYILPIFINKIVFHPEDSFQQLLFVRNEKEDNDENFSSDDEEINVANGVTFTGIEEKEDTQEASPDAKYKSNAVLDKNRPSLPCYKKLYIFYCKTPKIKFYSNLISYCLFLCIFSYMSMIKKEKEYFTIPEGIVAIYVISLAVAEIYQITLCESDSIRTKFKEWFSSSWNKLDAMAILIYFVGLGLSLDENTIDIATLIFAINGGFWVVRLLYVFNAHPILGPYVVMIYRMTYDLLYFVIVLCVFLLSYGVSSRAILKPQDKTHNLGHMFVDVIYHPYFNIYGELFTDRDPNDNNTTRFGTRVVNSYAEPVAWVLLGLYLLITNILLMNILIAAFNNTFNSVQENATQIWKFQQHDLVIEYAEKAHLPPPLSLIVHFLLAIRWCLQQCGLFQQKIARGRCLKAYVSDERKEELIEFENNCVALFVRKRASRCSKAVENASSELVEDIHDIQTSIDDLRKKLRELEKGLKRRYDETSLSFEHG